MPQAHGSTALGSHGKKFNAPGANAFRRGGVGMFAAGRAVAAAACAIELSRE